MNQEKSQPSMRSNANYYLAKPKSGKGRPVLVLHAWWGLSEFIKEFCDRLAKEGFVALAPDLYHGAVASTIEQAKKLSSTLEQDVVAQEITQAVDQLQGIGGTNTPGIGVIGFSLGGSWALWLASQKSNPVDATVVYYATGNEDYAQSHSAFQFHHAGTDDFEPTSEVEKLQNSLSAAGKPAEFYSYAGTTHWFFESDRTDAYHAESAKLAWNRTVEFLKAHIKET
jgi:carboxymethylenebutenolidase